MSWEERIYDCSGKPAPNKLDNVELCPDRFVSHIPPFQWQKLLAAVREREENDDKVLSTVPIMQVGYLFLIQFQFFLIEIRIIICWWY